MQTRFNNAKRGIVALATMGLISSGLLVTSPAAQAVTPANNRSDKIAFIRNGIELVLKRADGVGGTDVLLSGCGALSDPTWAPDNTRLAVRAVGAANCLGVAAAATGIYIVEADGSGGFHMSGSGSDLDPSWSPDGTKIAVERGADIYLLKAPPLGASSGSASGATQLTNGTNDDDPTWSPNGQFVAYVDGNAVLTIPSDGSTNFNGTAVTISSPINRANPTWGFGSGSDSRILFEHNSGLSYVRNNGSKVEQAIPTTGAGHDDPMYSPDDDRLLFELVGDCTHTGAVNPFQDNHTFQTGSCADPVWGANAVVPNPPLAASPSSLALSAAPGLTAHQTVVVTNIAGAPKQISGSTLVTPMHLGTPVFQFVQSSCGTIGGPSNTTLGSKTLGTGASCAITVMFNAPFSAGPFVGHISMDDPLIIDLVGTVSGSGGGGGGSGDLDANKSLMNFGGVKKGKSATIKVKITNNGNAAAGTNPISVSGKYFSLKKEDCPSSLKAGKSCTVVVKFNPKAKGSFTGELTVDGVSVDLKGKGK